MLKRKVIICLLGLMCLSPISGFLTVVCHGSDGHIAIESVVHNHCPYPEATETDNRDKFAAPTIHSSEDHDHCRDTIAASSIVISARKNVKLSTQKILISHIYRKADTTNASSDIGLAAYSNTSSAFHTPLRTVILLA